MTEAAADLLLPLRQETLRAIATTGVVRQFPKQSILINEGDVGDTLYIILTGRVKVYASNAAGREVVINFHGAGEYVGEMSLDGSPRSASVVTVEPTTCAVVNRAQFREFIAANPDFAQHLIRTLIHRARSATENMKSLAPPDDDGRLVTQAQPLRLLDDGPGDPGAPAVHHASWVGIATLGRMSDRGTQQGGPWTGSSARPLEVSRLHLPGELLPQSSPPCRASRQRAQHVAPAEDPVTAVRHVPVPRTTDHVATGRDGHGDANGVGSPGPQRRERVVHDDHACVPGQPAAQGSLQRASVLRSIDTGPGDEQDGDLAAAGDAIGERRDPVRGGVQAMALGVGAGTLDTGEPLAVRGR